MSTATLKRKPASVPAQAQPVDRGLGTLTVLHPKQMRHYRSRARFNIVCAGRRSGKTEIAVRRKVRRALSESRWPDALFIFAAPTHDQAKRLFWDRLKRLVPPHLRRKAPNESHRTITLLNGAVLWCVGLDVPERLEGIPIVDGVISEFGNVKRRAWEETIRPALSDRQGGMDLEGVPEGKNHYYELWEKCIDDDEWERHHWTSAEVMPVYLGKEAAERELASARGIMDPRTYDQEYEASFVNFAGRAYYQYSADVHRRDVRRFYNPREPLIFCFDFNKAPGVCAVCQEVPSALIKPHIPDLKFKDVVTCVIGEVWIPTDSNTELVCGKLLSDWHAHEGDVLCYGDPAGGHGGSSVVKGNDWDLIRGKLRPRWGHLKVRVSKAPPAIITRVNAVNSRLKAINGHVGALIDAVHAKHLAHDLDAVAVKEGTSDKLEKEKDSKLTHISDAWGYYIEKKFPIVGGQSITVTYV